MHELLKSLHAGYEVRADHTDGHATGYYRIFARRENIAYWTLIGITGHGLSTREELQAESEKMMDAAVRFRADVREG